MPDNGPHDAEFHKRKSARHTLAGGRAQSMEEAPTRLHRSREASPAMRAGKIGAAACVPLRCSASARLVCVAVTVLANELIRRTIKSQEEDPRMPAILEDDA